MANLSNHSHRSLGHGIPIMTTELVVYFPADWNYFEGFRKTAQETMALSSMIWACNFLEKFWDRHHLISNWKNQEERMMAYPPSNQTWLAGKFPSKMDTRMARTEGVSCFRILNHESVVPPNQVTTWSARLWERQLLRRHVCVYIYICTSSCVYIYICICIELMNWKISKLENDSPCHPVEGLVDPQAYTRGCKGWNHQTHPGLFLTCWCCTKLPETQGFPWRLWGPPGQSGTLAAKPGVEVSPSNVE